MKKLYLKKSFFIIFLFVGLALTYALSPSSEFIEKYYSSNFYRFISQALSSATGYIPFSLAELIIILLILLTIWSLAQTIRRVYKDPDNKTHHVLNFIINILIAVSLIYFGFVITWGLNYYRHPFSKIANLDVRPASVNELEGLCYNLIERANKLRSSISEKPDGTMYIDGRYKNVFNRAFKGYDTASMTYPVLGGNYGRPKMVLLSVAMSYAGISGVYFPFTSEANVNVDITDSMLPCTACHEMAHQRGFAREDEANYISYLACISHPDADFQYSGILLALINSMDALYSHNQERYLTLRKNYSDGVKRDLSEISKFWAQYEGPIEEISNKINDTYLKANNQSDGVYSYGRMVDLLIADYRKNP